MSAPADKPVKKVVLAYSGGLDTSIILKWLQTEYGAEVVTLEFEWGKPVDPAVVEEALKAAPAKVFAFVHAETSTGARPAMRRIAAATPSGEKLSSRIIWAPAASTSSIWSARSTSTSTARPPAAAAASFVARPTVTAVLISALAAVVLIVLSALVVTSVDLLAKVPLEQHLPDEVSSFAPSIEPGIGGWLVMTAGVTVGIGSALMLSGPGMAGRRRRKTRR